MTGSEKQIAWATRISNEFQASINAVAARFETAGNVSDAAKLRAGVATMTEQHMDAGWWIDHQSSLKPELQKIVMAA